MGIKKIHYKFTCSSMILRIKVCFFNYINDIFKKNLIDKKILLKKLSRIFLVDLKKESNIKLINK